MRYLFWIIRGCGHSGRRTQLREYIGREHIDIVALQETIKTDFTYRDLTAIDPLQRFLWGLVPSNGHSGNLLLGCNCDVSDVVSWDRGSFFIVATIKHRISLASWVIVCVYGPADHSRSAEFLNEIQVLVGTKQATNIPIVLGGDFNHIRSRADKNNRNIDWPRVAMFNNAIAASTLREIAQTGARFTWTNKQLALVRSVLDRVFVSSHWEVHFPLCTLVAKTRIGSDHVPLILASGEDRIQRSRCFFFETSWFEVDGFIPLVIARWEREVAEAGRTRGPMDLWISTAGTLRCFSVAGGLTTEVSQKERGKLF